MVTPIEQRFPSSVRSSRVAENALYPYGSLSKERAGALLGRVDLEVLVQSERRGGDERRRASSAERAFEPRGFVLALGAEEGQKSDPSNEELRSARGASSAETAARVGLFRRGIARFPAGRSAGVVPIDTLIRQFFGAFDNRAGRAPWSMRTSPCSAKKPLRAAISRTTRARLVG